MNDVQFSKRTAKAMNSGLFLEYPLQKRFEIINAIAVVDTFEELPAWLQQAIIDSETQTASAAYDPSQPRDPTTGQWIDSGSETLDADLPTEARKHATADEFVKSQGAPFIHGTPYKFKSFKKGNTAFFTPNRDFAQGYGETKSTDLELDAEVDIKERFGNVKLFNPSDEAQRKELVALLPEKVGVTSTWFGGDISKEEFERNLTGLYTVKASPYFKTANIGERIDYNGEVLRVVDRDKEFVYVNNMRDYDNIKDEKNKIINELYRVYSSEDYWKANSVFERFEKNPDEVEKEVNNPERFARIKKVSDPKLPIHKYPLNDYVEQGEVFWGTFEGSAPFIKAMKDLGYDGWKMQERGSPTYGLFNPEKLRTKEQLEKIWKHANKKKGAAFDQNQPRGENGQWIDSGSATLEADLPKEARKYKTAEEFVKSQGVPFYHGTPYQFKELKKGKITYFTVNRGFAEDYARTKSQDNEMDADIAVKERFGKVRLFDPTIDKDREAVVALLPEKIDTTGTWGGTTVSREEFSRRLVGKTTIHPDKFLKSPIGSTGNFSGEPVTIVDRDDKYTYFTKPNDSNEYEQNQVRMDLRIKYFDDPMALLTIFKRYKENPEVVEKELNNPHYLAKIKKISEWKPTVYKEIYDTYIDEDEVYWGTFEGSQEFVKVLKDLGYDGWKMSESKKPTYGLFNPEKLRSKEQLEEIWTQANKKKGAAFDPAQLRNPETGEWIQQEGVSGDQGKEKAVQNAKITLDVNQRYIDDIDLIHGKKQGNKPKKINEGDVFVIHEGGDVVYKRVIPSNPNANPDIIAQKEYEKLKLIGDLAPKSVLIKQNNENIIIQEKLPIILSKSESEKWANTNLIGLPHREIEIGKDRDGNIKIFDLSEIDIDEIKAFFPNNTGQWIDKGEARGTAEPKTKGQKTALTVYHGGNKIEGDVKLKKSKWAGTFYVTDDPEYAKSFGGVGSSVTEMVIDPTANLIDMRRPTEEQIKVIADKIDATKSDFYPHTKKDVINGLSQGKAYYAEMPQIKKILKGLGYDGQITSEVSFAKNIGIWNKEVIKVKGAAFDPAQLRNPETGEWISGAPGTALSLPLDPTNVKAPAELKKIQHIDEIDKKYRPELDKHKVGSEAWDAIYKQKQKEEGDWMQAIKIEVSLGRMEEQDAKKLGFYHRGSEMKPLPETLYHVTTNKLAVEATGLKTRVELNQESGKGLGGGTDDTISLSGDLKIAYAIKEGMIEGQAVASGKITVQDLIDQAKAGTGAKKPFWDLVTENHPDADQRQDSALYWLKQGKILHQPTFGEQTKEDFVSKYNSGWKKKTELSDWTPLGEPDPKGRYKLFVLDASPDELRQETFEFYQNWTAWREFAGGKYDPLFMSTDIKGLGKINPADIEILEFKPTPGAKGYQMSAMGEWRIYTGQAVELVGVPSKKGAAFDPSQLRDPNTGQWVDTGGVVGTGAVSIPASSFVRYPHREMAIKIAKKEMYMEDYGEVFKAGGGFPVKPMALEKQRSTFEKAASKNSTILGNTDVVLIDGLAGTLGAFTDPARLNRIFLPRYDEKYGEFMVDGYKYNNIFNIVNRSPNIRTTNPNIDKVVSDIDTCTFDDVADLFLLHENGHLKTFELIKEKTGDSENYDKNGTLLKTFSEYLSHPSLAKTLHGRPMDNENIVAGEMIAEDYRVMVGLEMGQKQGSIPNKYSAEDDLNNPTQANERRALLKKAFGW